MPLWRPNDLGSLKGAFQALIDRLGGLAPAAELGQRSQSRLSRMCDPADKKTYPTIDVVLALEMAAGSPIVTGYMAARQGAVLTPMEKGDGDLGRDYVRVTADAASLFADYAGSIAGNGLDKATRQKLLADLDALLEGAGRMRRDLLGDLP